MRPIRRSILLLAATAACVAPMTACVTPDRSADERLRTALGLGEGPALTESQVERRLAEQVAIGATEPELARWAQAVGVGRDGLSSYHWIPGRNLVAVRFEFDPAKFAATKHQWIISLQLDADRRLQFIAARRFVAGL